jgi:hypothetical protein
MLGKICHSIPILVFYVLDDFIGAISSIQNLTYQSQCHEAVTDNSGRYAFYVPLNNIPSDVKKLR